MKENSLAHFNKFLVYGYEKNDTFQWDYSADIEVDKSYLFFHGIDQLFVIEQKFSIGNANELIECLKNKKRASSNLIRILASCDAKLTLKENSTLAIDNNFAKHLKYYNHHKKAVLSFFQGKVLLMEELLAFFSLPEINMDDLELSKFIQIGYLLNEIDIVPGVAYPKNYQRNKPNKLVCNRCGSTDKVFIRECHICNDNCATCEECITLGRSKTCSPLVFFKLNQNSELDNRVLSNFNYLDLVPTLTNFQRIVAKQTLAFFQGNEFQEMLIWAVTGAGKTEIIFPVIKNALESGHKVLLATPRKDVVTELSPRLRNYFPNTAIVSLYGGSKEKWSEGDLYIATTHQVIRFKEFFELVILDEADAFPYNNQPILENAVKRARKKTGRMIFLTATPPKQWIEKAKRKELLLSILSVRYHSQPLPIPDLKLTTKKPHNTIKEFVGKVRELDGQAFIFLPNINGVIEWTKKLKEWFGESEIEGVYANNQNREKNVELFKQGKIRFLVTTTIMERGITVQNVHVMVIYANSKIFDQATLIQIAGRVGRSAQYPSGLVWFLGEYFTREMVSAKRQIKKLNKARLIFTKFSETYFED